MDLRNGQIPVGELLSNPEVRKIAQQEFKGVLNHPMLQMFSHMPASSVVGIARGYVSQEKIDEVIRKLQEL